MKLKNSLIVFSVIVMLLIGGISAYAIEAKPSTPKEEIIYGTLDSTGKVEDLYAVNKFETGVITDYGDYSSVKNLNTTAEITSDGDMITIDGEENEKTYYQGNLKSTNLPWNFVFHYTLNGKEISPGNLAEKSGELEIAIDITPNKAVDSFYYNHYALEMTLSLDTKSATLESAKGATIANVGENKQLSYIFLPGSEQHIIIKATVENFTMDAPSVNGIRLGLDINIESAELQDKVAQIQSAAEQLYGGSSQLSQGTAELADSTGELQEGTEAISGGTQELADGINQLISGLSVASSGLEELADHSDELTAGSQEIYNTLNLIDSGLKDVTIEANNLNQLMEASDSINSVLEELASGTEQLSNSISDYNIDDSLSDTEKSTLMSILQDNIARIDATLELLESYSTIAQDTSFADDLNTGREQLLSARDDLNKACLILDSGDTVALKTIREKLEMVQNATAGLSAKTKEVSYNYNEFNEELKNFATSITTLSTKMAVLRDAIVTLTAEYSTFHKGLENYTDSVAEIVAGFNYASDSLSILAIGSRQLSENTAMLSAGASEIHEGSEELSSGADKLTEGAYEFYTGTQGIDSEIQDTIDEMLSSLSGEDDDTISFVSAKNTSVSALQFVLTGTEIK